MSYRNASGNACLKCQARPECRCHPLDRPDMKYFDAGATSHGPKLMEKPCSGSGIQMTTTDKPRLTENPNYSCSILSYQKFEDNDSLCQHQVTQRLLVPPSGFRNPPGSDDHGAGLFTLPTRGGFLESIFSLALPGDQLDRSPHTPPGSETIEASQPNDDLDESESLEEIQAAAIGFLSLDRNTESNGLPFLLQAHATWLFHFMFEPLRIVHLARSDTVRNYVLGEEPRQMLNLMAENAYEITRSAEYDPAQSSSFSMTETILWRRLTKARTRIRTLGGLDRQHATDAMLFTNQASHHLTLHPPYLPPSKVDLFNVQSRLPVKSSGFHATVNVTLQHYSTVDVLLSVLTGRPMFFRYTVHFTPEVPESCFYLVDAPGLRWAYGVPDRLVMTFAQMNTLREEFGPHVPTQVVVELEQEIKRMNPIIASSTEPLVALGRMVVQECWFLAALIYLYMGLCGGDSTDIRVGNVRTRFMRLLALVRPKRNPDSFIVFPMTILGIATDDWEEQDIIRRRMLGVSECAYPGRMGNDLVRILDNVWSKRGAAVWSHLRQACWEVAGV
ncbi:unnamed protein product [Rhizoctonia solani]|uniref:Uncharacterized protein n=1 Tax=Rhizoctonia solani TaxID=456999 RepID=A0A8H3A6C8_9AGAM|nr:unnamed protein product [Rhizoctonia solani]